MVNTINTVYLEAVYFGKNTVYHLETGSSWKGIGSWLWGKLGLSESGRCDRQVVLSCCVIFCLKKINIIDKKFRYVPFGTNK